MKRIAQTITDEAFEVYDELTDKKNGLSAALLALKYLDIPGEIYKAIFTGDISVLEGLKSKDRKLSLKSDIPAAGAKRGRPAKVITEAVERVVETPVIVKEIAAAPIIKEIVPTVVEAEKEVITSVEKVEEIISTVEMIVVDEEEEFVVFDPFGQMQ